MNRGNTNISVNHINGEEKEPKSKMTDSSSIISVFSVCLQPGNDEKASPIDCWSCVHKYTKHLEYLDAVDIELKRQFVDEEEELKDNILGKLKNVNDWGNISESKLVEEGLRYFRNLLAKKFRATIHRGTPFEIELEDKERELENVKGKKAKKDDKSEVDKKITDTGKQIKKLKDEDIQSGSSETNQIVVLQDTTKDKTSKVNITTEVKTSQSDGKNEVCGYGCVKPSKDDEKIYNKSITYEDYVDDEDESEDSRDKYTKRIRRQLLKAAELRGVKISTYEAKAGPNPEYRATTAIRCHTSLGSIISNSGNIQQTDRNTISVHIRDAPMPSPAARDGVHIGDAPIPSPVAGGNGQVDEKQPLPTKVDDRISGHPEVNKNCEIGDCDRKHLEPCHGVIFRIAQACKDQSNSTRKILYEIALKSLNEGTTLLEAYVSSGHRLMSNNDKTGMLISIWRLVRDEAITNAIGKSREAIKSKIVARRRRCGTIILGVMAFVVIAAAFVAVFLDIYKV